MKTLFICTVLMAAGYLFLPAGFTGKFTDNFAKLLPQNKIEQAADTLLLRVDEKLKSAKAELSAKQQQRINELEKNVNGLTAKLTDYQQQLEQRNETRTLMVNNAANTDVTILKNSDELGSKEPADEFILQEEGFAQTQYIENKPFSEGNKVESTQSTVIDNSEKQLRIKRQAKLQDIADRMNATSILALTY